jgi:histidinol-phosphate/aromatic aminotransferase/cobyric acid decarboxylase-like protein/choline kinase
MKALILAAGFGNRMSPLTNNKHKTLLEVDGEPIMDRIIKSLLLNNINKILIVTGYRSDELVNHVVNKFPNVQFEFVNNERYRETNNIYSLSLAFEQTILDDDILLIESDLIYTTDVITKAIFSNYDNVALVSPYVIGLDGTVVQVSNNQITNIFPPHLQDDKFNLFDKFKTLNIYKFSKDFCNNEFKKLLTYYANVIDDNCYYELILGILIYMQKRNIYCEVIPNEKWVEVDDPNDMMGAEFVFNVKKRVEILEDSFGGYWNYDIVDFCFIRNMYFPTKSMLAELNNNLIDLLSNYGSKQYILNKKLSYVLQYNAQYLLVLNGAAQVYPILKKLFSSKKGLIPNPTFGEYNRIFDDFDTYVDFGDSNIEVNDKIIKSEIVIFVNPNNPTGTTISTNKIFEIVRTFPNKFFVIDESFIEFSDEISIIDFIEKEKFTNVLVIRSMSKTYGLPGIRLGFIYTCNLELYKKISENIPIWNLNSVAEFYLEIILKNKRSLDNSFTKTKSDRYELHNLLKEIIQISKVYQSGANFILFRIDNRIFDSKNLVNYLLQNHSIYIKEVTDKFEDQSFRYYRAAVRLPNENSLLINSINNFFSKS